MRLGDSGVNQPGHKQFLAIEDGVRTSIQSWREVLLNLKSLGMNEPELAIGDGALGFWQAVDEVYPKSQHQRCWIHKTGNVLNKLPKSVQAKAKRDLHNIWDEESKAAAQHAFTTFVHTCETKYPKATQCLEKDRAELMAFYSFPANTGAASARPTRLNRRLPPFVIVLNEPGAVLAETEC